MAPAKHFIALFFTCGTNEHVILVNFVICIQRNAATSAKKKNEVIILSVIFSHTDRKMLPFYYCLPNSADKPNLCFF